jgi:hypothetical protein
MNAIQTKVFLAIIAFIILAAAVNWEGEPAPRFPLPTLAPKVRGSLLPFPTDLLIGVRPRGRLPLGSLSSGSPWYAPWHTAGHVCRSSKHRERIQP